ncbi:MAG: hypothetical protein ACJ72N_23775 [Labedaea sp.]
MLYALILLALMIMGFWRSLFKILIAILVALLILGGIQVVHAIDVATAGPQEALSLGQSPTQSTIAVDSLGVGTRPSITFTRNSTAKLLA